METYSGFSDSALAEFVEVDEELSDADSVLGDAGLDPLLNVLLVAEHRGVALVAALMAMGGRAHVLNVVAD